MRMLKLADGRVKILVQGLAKGEVDSYLKERPFFEVKIRKVVEPTFAEVPIEVEALMRTAKEKIEQILNLKNLPPEIVMVTDNISDPGVLADLVASNCGSRSTRAKRSSKFRSNRTVERKSTNC